MFFFVKAKMYADDLTIYANIYLFYFFLFIFIFHSQINNKYMYAIMDKRMGMAQGLPSPILRPVTLNDTFEVNNIACIQNRIRQRIPKNCGSMHKRRFKY